MMTMFRLVAVVILSFLMTACTSFIKEPQVAFKRMNVVTVDSSGIDMEFYLGIRNPNSFDFSLLGYTYDLKVMTLPLAAGGLQETLVFPAGEETDMRLPVRIKYGELIDILKRHPDPNKIPYSMDARLHMKTPLGEMLIPVTTSGTLSIPEKYRPDTYLERFRNILRGVR
jgi:LEA14-like dessication related protein